MKTYCKNIKLCWVEIKPNYFIEQCTCEHCKRNACLFRNPNLTTHEPRN